MYFMTVIFQVLVCYCYLLLLFLILINVDLWGVLSPMLLNKSQEESSETGINRRYKNSCLPSKKTHFGFLNFTELFL